MKIHTELESAIDRRNIYQGRMVDSLANIVFFKKLVTTAKTDTQEKVTAMKELAKCESELKTDLTILKSFDEVIAKLKKAKKAN